MPGRHSVIDHYGHFLKKHFNRFYSIINDQGAMIAFIFAIDLKPLALAACVVNSTQI